MISGCLGEPKNENPSATSNPVAGKTSSQKIRNFRGTIDVRGGGVQAEKIQAQKSPGIIFATLDGETMIVLDDDRYILIALLLVLFFMGLFILFLFWEVYL